MTAPRLRGAPLGGDRMNAQHTSVSHYVGGCSLLPEDRDLTEISISNVVPIVFLSQYAHVENMAADARGEAT